MNTLVMILKWYVQNNLINKNYSGNNTIVMNSTQFVQSNLIRAQLVKVTLVLGPHELKYTHTQIYLAYSVLDFLQSMFYVKIPSSNSNKLPESTAHLILATMCM